MRYADDVPKIAAAAITTEDAELIARRVAAGPTEVRLRLESQQLPDAPSANVIAEIRGRELPDEVVVIGAHIDSWDVGQGAHDDGAGCVMMMQALTTIRTLGLQPRRTIRVVLFTNEENGLRGGRGYAKDHAAEVSNTVLALEADSGGFKPIGFSVELKDGTDPARSQLTRTRISAVADLLRPLAAMRVIESHSGADISPLVEAGVPGVGLIVDSSKYFDVHHTNADTLDKVDPDDLAQATTAVAVFAYIVADLPTRIDAP
jgi:Zn-dependent M28 family amino/carboxypeptidase